MKNFLNNKEFLNQLFSSKEREIYARITALTFNEMPVEYIEGKVIDGSINIDGSSAVRRTCNLTLMAQEINIHDFYWGVKNKFKLEVGLKNMINPSYPDIIWFKQGMFVITQFNTTQNTNKWTIKIQGKDKMCLLNGDISGNLPFNVDFSHEEYIDLETNQSTFTPVPIKTIIKKALTELGKELEYNILINDIDETGQELLEYRGLEPLYIVKDIDSQEYKQMYINQEQTVYYQLKEKLSKSDYDKIPEKYIFLKDIYIQVNDEYIFDQKKANNNVDYQNYIYETENWFKGTLSDDFNITYDDLLDDSEFEGGIPATEVRFNLREEYVNKRYTIAKIITGDVPGYRLSELVYAGELKANIGESLTSVLDKIKNQFTNFEYFYDVNGKFVFQKRKEYLVTQWNPNDENNDILYLNSIDSQPLFNFVDNMLISSIQNTPKIQELKNDYSVWGARDKLALHMRYAIDKKPISYKPIRPLKEEYITIIRDENGKCIEEKVEYKYYNAPEVEPYNDEGLICEKISYNILKLLENENGFFQFDYEMIAKNLNLFDENSQWLNLFEKKENKYYFKGNIDDLKDIFIMLLDKSFIYDCKPQYSFIPLEDNKEEWHIMYSYFAEYPYGIEDITILDEKNNKKIIHHKIDWRELIYQMALDYRKLNYTDNYWYYLNKENPWCLNHQTGYEQYYIDLEGFWRLLYNPNPKDEHYNNNILNGNFWSKDIFENPRALTFWFDFLDPNNSELAKYSVPAIGSRTKVVNDKNVKTVHHEEIPNIIFYNNESKNLAQFSGYSYINITNAFSNLFSISSKGKTAKERIDELLYNHSYCQESVNLTVVPIYTLEPNNRIYIQDNNSGINGEYLINKITIPLNYKNMMSITAIKAVNSIT